MSEEITESQKREILKQLVNDEEIVMLYDSMNNCYRPLWKNEWDIQLEYDEPHNVSASYTATENDIDLILENGILEWENDGNSWYVKIWW